MSGAAVTYSDRKKDKYWKGHKSFIFPIEFTYFITPGITYIRSEINDLFEKKEVL